MPAGPSKAVPGPHRHGGKLSDKDFRVRQGNTRNHILQVAIEEFSAKGFDGARVDSIAVRAGVSKNVIYHYFKSKESLFVEVMEHTYGGIRSLQDDLFEKDLDPEGVIKELTRSTFRYYLDSPGTISLINSENLHKAIHIKSSAGIKERYRILVDYLDKAITKGHKEGSFTIKPDAIELYITISGISYFYLSNIHTLSYVLDKDLMSEKSIDSWENHIISVIIRFLKS